MICAPAQALAQALQKLATKAPSQHKYGIHILKTDQAPWAPQVVYVGAMAVRGGMNSASNESHDNESDDLEAKDANGLTPLHWAAKLGDIDATALLLAANVEVNAKH